MKMGIRGYSLHGHVILMTMLQNNANVTGDWLPHNP